MIFSSLQPLALVTGLGLLARLAVATGGLNGLPVLNGPIPLVPQIEGSKSRIGDFVHPGLWHTHDDLERIRLGVVNEQEPYISAYANFSANIINIRGKSINYKRRNLRGWRGEFV
jgi:hypothetical protein